MKEATKDYRPVASLGECFYVPKAISVCPYCNGELIAQIQEISEIEGKTDLFEATSISVDCMNEPPIGSKNWVDWDKSHSTMPYVYQLPAQLKVQKWLNEIYYFE